MAEFVEVIKQKERMCWFQEIDCNGCKLKELMDKHNITSCSKVLLQYPQEAENIIMEWSDEHKIQTNADKFKEIFGVGINETDCCLKVECKYSNCRECEWDDFWYREYKEPKEV